MKLHFKIISCSSEDITGPVTNLVSGSGMWQSARFCEYPQQITIQFYEPVVVQSIHIASHQSKISSRINILFCLPDKAKFNSAPKFQKFGYFQFANNQSTDYKLRQLKKIEQINQNAAFVRIILWKNHQNAQNFFNQVGLSQLIVYGSPYSIKTLPPVINNKSMLMNISISDYIQNKLQVLQQFKQQFSKQDDFENAKKIKQIIKVIKFHGQKLKKLDEDKKNAVGNQEYEKARQIKTQMEQLRSDIQHITNNFYDPNKKVIKPLLKQERFKAKMDQILSNSRNASLNQSRVSNNTKKLKIEILQQQKQVKSDEQKIENQQINNDVQDQQSEEKSQVDQSRVSYDNRIVPAVLRKNKKQSPQKLQNAALEDPGFQDNQFLEKPKNQQQIVLEDMTPSAEVNAAVLIQFYDKEIVKKLHSKHWNFKLQALNKIMEQTKNWLASASELEKNRVKSVLFTFNKIMKEGNFQLNNLNLDLLAQLLNSKKSASKNLQTQIHSDLQKSINQLFLKMGDSQKIKQKCQDLINKMLIKDLYGVNFVYQTIVKSYFNQTLTHNLKIKKYKLSVVDSMLDKYGIGSANGLPMTAVDFVCKVAEDNNDEIRKQATIILKKMKSKGAGNKVIETVRSKKSLKGSIVKQIEG